MTINFLGLEARGRTKKCNDHKVPGAMIILPIPFRAKFINLDVILIYSVGHQFTYFARNMGHPVGTVVSILQSSTRLFNRLFNYLLCLGSLPHGLGLLCLHLLHLHLLHSGTVRPGSPFHQGTKGWGCPCFFVLVRFRQIYKYIYDFIILNSFLSQNKTSRIRAWQIKHYLQDKGDREQGF